MSYKFQILRSLSFPLLFICLKCEFQRDEKLYKLSREEILQIHQNEAFNVEHAVFLTKNHKKISEQDVKKLKTKEFACDFYADSSQLIRQVIVRPANYHDHITSILINNINYHPNEGIPLMAIDCDSLEYNIEKLHHAKLEELSELEGGDTLGYFALQRVKIVSIVEHCGLPSITTIGTNGLKVFWSMIHHNEAPVIAHYYLYFENMVKNGSLNEERLALMTDRMLMNNNYPQVYGSQILNYKLHPIGNPDSVNYRRAAIGLEPLEEYLKNFDLD